MASATNAWGLGSVERRSTTDQVLHELRAAILAGRIKPDEQLPETALAAQFGTGRSAIREAIRHLVQEGLVVSEINRGARVRTISAEDVVDVYRARAAIEVAAVAAFLACDVAVSTAVAELQRAQDRIRAAAPPDASAAPSRELIEADLDFHRALVGLAGSPRLSRAHEPLAAECQMLMNWHPVYPLTNYVTDHQVILDAVLARDPAAPDLARGHLDMTVELIVGEASRYADRLARSTSFTSQDSHNEGSLG